MRMTTTADLTAKQISYAPDIDRSQRPTPPQGETTPELLVPNIQQGSTTPSIPSPIIEQGETTPTIPNPDIQQGSTTPVISNPIIQQGDSTPIIPNPIIEQGSSTPIIPNPIINQGSTDPIISSPNIEQGSTTPIISDIDISQGSTSVPSYSYEPIQSPYGVIQDGTPIESTAIQANVTNVPLDPISKQGSTSIVAPELVIQQGDIDITLPNVIINQGETTPVIPNPDIQQGSETPIIPSPDIIQGSTSPIIPNPDIQQGSTDPIIPTFNIEQGQTTPIIPNVIVEQGSTTPVIPNPIINQGFTDPIIPNPNIQQGGVDPIIPNPNIEQGSSTPIIPNPIIEQGNTTPTIPVLDIVQGETTPIIPNPNIQQGGVDPIIPNPNIEQGGVDPIIPNPIIEQGSVDPIIPNPNIEQGSTDPIIPNPIIDQGSSTPIIPSPTIEQGETTPVVPSPNIQQGSTDPVIPNPTINQGSSTPIVPNPNIQQGQTTPIIPNPTINQGSSTPIIPNPTINQGSSTPIIPNPTINQGSTTPIVPNPTINQGSSTPIIPSLTINQGSTTPIVPSPTINQGSSTPIIPNPTINQGQTTPIIPIVNIQQGATLVNTQPGNWLDPNGGTTISERFAGNQVLSTQSQTSVVDSLRYADEWKPLPFTTPIIGETINSLAGFNVPIVGGSSVGPIISGLLGSVGLGEAASIGLFLASLPLTLYRRAEGALIIGNMAATIAYNQSRTSANRQFDTAPGGTINNEFELISIGKSLLGLDNESSVAEHFKTTPEDFIPYERPDQFYGGVGNNGGIPTNVEAPNTLGGYSVLTYQNIASRAAQSQTQRGIPLEDPFDLDLPGVREPADSFDTKQVLSKYSWYLPSNDDHEIIEELSYNNPHIVDPMMAYDSYKDNEELLKDFIKLTFTDVRTENTFQFRSYIENVSDRFNPNWQDVNYIGRPNPLKSFVNVTRDLSLDFIVPALSRGEMQMMYSKLSRLANLTMPMGVGVMQAPIMRFTLGDWFVDEIAHVSSLSFTVENDYTWEVNIEGDFVELPHIIKVSMGIFIIGNTAMDANKYNAFGGNHGGPEQRRNNAVYNNAYTQGDRALGDKIKFDPMSIRGSNALQGIENEDLPIE